MEFLTVKPLSVNEVWKGKRFKTTAYKEYELKLLWLLPKILLPPPPYEIHFIFGVSNSQADFDNPIKPFLDVLQKKYGFNDKLVIRATIDKVIVKRGHEYIGFSIKTK